METLLPKDHELPNIVYHASRHGELATIEPRNEKSRDPKEGPVVFATPRRAVASMFLVPWDDSWVESGTADGVPFMLIADKERWEALDHGGYIYTLPGATFITDLSKGLRESECTSKESVEPLSVEHITNALEEMKRCGVRVKFTSMEELLRMRAMPDGGEVFMREWVLN